MTGTVTRAATLKVGYFAQHQVDELDMDGSPYDHVRRLMPDTPEAKVRGRVGAIGFSQARRQHQGFKTLSGGEKARLLLGLATFAAPHLIILDEPTNHLDIDSRAALIEAINDYPGAVILVSHDRYLLEACVDRLWLVAGGKVKPFDGDLDDYRRHVLAVGHPRKYRRLEIRGARRSGASAPRCGRQTRRNRALAQESLSSRTRDRAAHAPASASSTPPCRRRAVCHAIRRAPPNCRRRARKSLQRLPRRKRNGSPPARALETA